jgi:hypothetical protein
MIALEANVGKGLAVLDFLGLRQAAALTESLAGS